MAEIELREARPGDVPALVELIDQATYGFVEHVFSVMSTPGTDPRRAVAAAVAEPASQLSLRKARVADSGGRVAGFIMCKDLPDPADLLSKDTPDILRPIFELESEAPGTRLVDFVASRPDMRGKGVGTLLVRHAERGEGPNGMSLTIHDRNLDARRLYERLGFRQVDRRPILKQGWDHPAEDWVLMVRPPAGA